MHLHKTLLCVFFLLLIFDVIFFIRNNTYKCQKTAFFKLGVVLSHAVIFQIITLLSKIYVKPTGNDSSSSAIEGLPYRVNYMVDLDTYYVPIFIHTATCDIFYSLLMLIFDVLYLTLIQHCCGLFAALRSVKEILYEYFSEIKYSLFY